MKIRPSLPLFPLLALTSLAAAQPLQSRFWSDARLLPSQSRTEADLLQQKGLACPLPGTAARSDAAQQALTQLQAAVASLPQGDPGRAALQKTLDLMRRNTPTAAPSTPAASTPLTLAQALKNARTWLSVHDAAGVRAFALSTDSQSAAAADGAAMQASLLGRPDAALAALLAAHDLTPKNADTLVNLGGVLGALGLPQEALAVLQAALALKPSPSGALGISQRAVALNNQGYALLQLGRWADADRVLAQAQTLEPALSEASSNRARALLCQGNTQAAAAAFRRGSRRTSPASMPGKTGTPTASTDLPLSQPGQQPPDQTQRPPSFTFDLSHGTQTTLPVLRIPSTPGETAALADSYQALYLDLSNRALKLQRQQEAVEQQLKARSETVPAVDERRDALWWAMLSVDAQPNIAALKTQMEHSQKEPDRLWTDFWHCEGGCTIDVISRRAKTKEEFSGLCVPALQAAHNAWRGAMHNAEIDLGAYLKATYATETALAANYSDPLWHDRASLQAEIGATVLTAGYAHDAEVWARDIAQSPNCVAESDRKPSTTEQVAGPLELPRAPLCKQLFDGFSASVSLSVVGFSVSCDTFSVKVSNPGWIGAFAKLSLKTETPNWKSTVTIGVAEGASLPGTGIGLGASQGMYLTVDRQGNLLDLGMVADAGASASGKFGPIKIGKSVGGWSGKWSFIASEN
ncbi:tetratricopeptide repeat protein [Deinococcus ruber]|uniref:Tetratricopeptide repeat protein n=1 Tax=Deinococcus ruber TaxID=1848197 RepID=A0A918CMU0_9DEIO|nr:tetratricopeptide repeat protein [Deinococcus ruber]GGR30925.1 hypothetical protein GCM10008957_47070 [Deinococcus ruber]